MQNESRLPNDNSPAPAHVLRELRAAAGEWWYHVELRRRGQVQEARGRERESIRFFAAANPVGPTSDGWVQIGRGVAALAIRGPMPGFAAAAFGANPDGGLSTRQWRVIFNRCAARKGAVFHNCDPQPEPWHPRPPTV